MEKFLNNKSKILFGRWLNSSTRIYEKSMNIKYQKEINFKEAKLNILIDINTFSYKLLSEVKFFYIKYLDILLI